MTLGTALAGDTTLVLSLNRRAIYEALVTLLVSHSGDPDLAPRANVATAQWLAEIYAQLMSKPGI